MNPIVSLYALRRCVFITLCLTGMTSLLSKAYAAEATPALTLEQAIERSVKASPKLNAARAGIAASVGSELQASLWPNPEASFEVENIAGTGPYNGVKNTELTLGVSQLIELGGKREARQRAAVAGHRVASTELGTAELDLVREVTTAYMEVVADEENMRLARDLEETARKVLEDVSRRVSAARDPLFQKSRADVALTNARIARERVEASLLSARQKLARYWNDPMVTQPIAADIFFTASAPAPLDSYREHLEQMPDFARFDGLRSQREAELSLARAGAVPDVKASFGVRQFPGTSDAALVAGISVPMPFFNQNQGEIARAGAEVTRVTHERQQAAQEREQELIQSWSDWQSAWNEATALKSKAVPEAGRAFNLALSGYRVGGFQYLDVLDTQRAFFETRSALVAALSRLHLARAQVERLAGTNPHPEQVSHD
jgi:cobalt-zinc-cadmium efflux system outer membrane protein